MSSCSPLDGTHHFCSHKVAKAAKARLEKSPYMTIRRMSCECDQGVLFLRGQLPNFYQKQLAQETVAKLEGVVQLVNEIEVIAPLP